MYFISIPFRFSGSNIIQNEMLTGSPSMTAIAGMAHNIERIMRYDLGIEGFRVRAFSFIYFSLFRDRHSVYRPSQAASPRTGIASIPGFSDTRRGFGEACITLSVDTESDEDFGLLSRHLEEQSDRQGVIDALHAGARFAGGTIEVGLSGEFQNRPLPVFMTSNWRSSLVRISKSYPSRGLLLSDYSSKLRDHCLRKSLGPIDGILDILYISACQLLESKVAGSAQAEPGKASIKASLIDPADAFSVDVLDDLLASMMDEVTQDAQGEAHTLEALGDQPHQGTIIPLQVGFHGITRLKNLHRYVEPIISLAQLRVLPSLILDINRVRADWRAHFWSWEVLDDLEIYRVASYFKGQ